MQRQAIPGHEGRYEISKDGVVYSLTANKVIATRDNGRGYLVVSLSVNGAYETRKIHRLVAITYIPNPDRLPQVNHLDGDKRNNNVSNLEWCTNDHNIKHASRLGLLKGTGRKSLGYVGTHLETNNVIRHGTLDEAEAHGFDGSTISKCCKGSRNYHKDYNWSYDNRRRAV